MKRKLFLFRVLGTNHCGAIRAATITEAADKLFAFFEQPVEITRTPERFSVFIPPWS